MYKTDRIGGIQLPERYHLTLRCSGAATTPAWGWQVQGRTSGRSTLLPNSKWRPKRQSQYQKWYLTLLFRQLNLLLCLEYSLAQPPRSVWGCSSPFTPFLLESGTSPEISLKLNLASKIFIPQLLNWERVANIFCLLFSLSF